MSTAIAERYDSRTIRDRSLELVYTIEAADESAAYTLLAGQAPLYLTHPDGTMLRTRTPSIEPQGGSLFLGKMTYSINGGSSSKRDVGDSQFSFETSGGTQHIQVSRQTLGKYAASGQAPDNHNLIGVSADSVEGCDITVPIYNFAETHIKSSAEVTYAYRGQVFRLTGQINSAPFKGCQPGECLFLGASGSRRGTKPEDDWEISYKFAALPNATLNIGDIRGIVKRGWDYLWIRYVKRVIGQGDNAIISMIPKYAYVERVYDEGVFAQLGIGS